jgi:predicted permease
MKIRTALDTLTQDVRFALRTLIKAPAFTLVAVTALSVSMGGAVAIFSLVDTMRAGALPYKEPDRLVQLWGNVQRARVERRGNSYPDFLDWRAQAKTFEDMAAFSDQTLTLNTGEEPERIGTESVSAPYFALLGVTPALGRTFRSDEDVLEQPVYVTILSDGLWKRKFGADPNVIGRQVRLSADTYTVIGVMPQGFRGVTDTAELWTAHALYAPAAAMKGRGNRGPGALARLRPEVTLAAAQLEMNTISRRLEQEYPESNEKRGVEVSPLEVELFGALRPALLTLLAAVCFVLLIACANVANLVLARSEGRRREVAVRTAMGARKSRLFAQMITESCVLVLLSALLGLGLARVAVIALMAGSPVVFPSFIAPALDGRVALFVLGASLVCAVIVGLAPAVQAEVKDLSGVLKETARGSDGRRAQKVRNALVVSEVSLAVVLLVGSFLMIRSVRNLAAIDPGFDPKSVLTVRVSVPRSTSPPPPSAPPQPADPSSPKAASAPSVPPSPVVQYQVLIERLRSLPGVVAVGLGTDLPLDGNASASFYSAEGMPATDAQAAPRAYNHRVSPEFFSALGIPLKAGRTFTAEEMTPASSAVIVSERLTERFWPGQDPIGKRIKFGGLTSTNPWMSIVGVASEVKYRGLPQNPTADPDIYLPFADRNSQYGFAIRTSVPPASLMAPLRAAIREADASIPIYSVSTLEERVLQQTASSRFTMWLMGVFAAMALSLAVIGLYGVMSYLVTQRTREIGVRVALGAQRRDIVRLVVANGARLVGAGLFLGVVLALALQRVASSLLFGVSVVDAASAGAVIALGAVAFLACYVPAARASRIDPLTALRYE